MRHPGLDGEGGGEREELCPGPRQTLTELPESEERVHWCNKFVSKNISNHLRS